MMALASAELQGFGRMVRLRVAVRSAIDERTTRSEPFDQAAIQPPKDSL